MKIFLSYLLCVFFAIANGQTQFKFNHFTTDDGLPTNSIYSITQSNNGDIVLGTDNGLTFFDGNDFKTLNVKNGLINPYIVSVCKDGNSAIWLINYNGKLQKFENNKIVNTPFFSKQTNVILNANSELWLFTTQNRFPNKSYYYIQINKKTQSVFSPKNNPIPTVFASPIFCQNNKKMEIKDNILTFENHKIVIPKEISLLHKVIFRKNDVCFLDDHFLFITDFDSNVLKKIKLPQSLSEKPIFQYNFITDNQENCWLNIQGKGLFLLKKDNNWEPISKNLGLNETDNINFLYCDNSGKIWIATNEKGLYCIPNTEITFIKFPKDNNYFNGFANSLDKETLFFSTKFNLFTLDLKNNIRLIKRTLEEVRIENHDSIPVLLTSLKQPTIWDKNLKMLIVQGKILLQYKNATSFSLFNQNEIFSYCNGKKNKILGENTQERIKNVVFHKNEYYFNNSKNITIRTFDKTKIKLIRTLNLKINGFIQDFAFVHDTLWIVTESQVYKTFHEKIIDSLPTINHTKLESVNKIKPINNNIYFCTSNGLFIISPNGNRVLNKYNFLPDNDVYNVAEFNNQLLVATKDGLAKVNTDLLLQKSEKPSLNLIYNSKICNKISVPSNNELIKIDLKIQNFNDSKNQIIQYKIDQSQWFVSQTKNIDFQSVSFGNHVITVRVKDVNSDWTTQSISVYRSFPFYLKWWFILGVILYLLGAIFVFYRYLLNKKITEKKLENATNNKIVELRQSALSAMMNPHFIFNSLNAIQYFVNSNQKEKSSEHLGKLARLVRLFLSQASEPFISISDEVNRLKLYLELEQLRFGNFEYDFQIDKNIDIFQTKIPNMIVQPFLENAILHGVSHLKENDGKINLIFHQENDVLTIQVLDNGYGITPKKSENNEHISKGISIITERLEILQQSYPEKIFTVSQKSLFQNTDRKGHEVLIKITILPTK